MFFLKPLNGDGAADAFAAIKHNRHIARNPGNIIRNFLKRNQQAAEVERGVFIGFTHINQHRRVLLTQQGIQFFRGD